MPQNLVAIHLPDNYNPSLEGEEMVRDIDVLNEESKAAGARFLAGGLQSAPRAKSLRSSPAERWSSPMDHTLGPRNTLAVFGYLAQPTWMRPWRGDAKPSSPCRASVDVREFLAMTTE
jgi:hypothetical protein